MSNSSCTVSFFRNDLQATRLWQGKCPVKNCSVDINKYQAPFQKHKDKMRYLPFCPEHGIRVHRQSGFVYYNGFSSDDLSVSTKRNLMFNSGYYIENFLKKSNKMESTRLCYENSEDAVSYNVFTKLASNGDALRKLVGYITNNNNIKDEIDLYLWGGKVDLKNNTFIKYNPLLTVRDHLEKDIKKFKTEPDIMLVIPKKIVICIEAKFGSKNPIAKDKEEAEGEKPRKTEKLIDRYCKGNDFINKDTLFDLSKMPGRFYEQIFRNIVFAASMAKLEGAKEWYVVNLRNQHVINLKKGKPESFPIMRNIRSILQPAYKKRFTHLTWESIYDKSVKDNEQLADLAWYLKNKSLSCGRAFNILK
ncbi:MAG: hypothetical protein NT088_02960 [Candidatus Omnitrophica bacterium]|nr:hypothetical protein [Candidatus Omnitrophota bacterium]